MTNSSPSRYHGAHQALQRKSFEADVKSVRLKRTGRAARPPDPLDQGPVYASFPAKHRPAANEPGAGLGALLTRTRQPTTSRAARRAQTLRHAKKTLSGSTGGTVRRQARLR